MLHGWLADGSLNADFVIIEPARDHLAWTSAHDNVRLHATVADAAANERAATIVAARPQAAASATLE